MTFLTARQLPSRADAAFVYAWMMLSVTAAMALFTLSAHDQNIELPAPAAEIAAVAPRYAASDLERAFGFMDGNKDGKVSRDEAAGFRGVAKHFDEADTNHDQFLSREEFDKAMNYVEPK